MHIAVTSLWILPVIRASAGVRVAYMIASAALQVLLSYWFYFDWVHTGGIDGGMLGFLAWTIPTIVGTLACDAVTAADGRPRLAKMIVWSIVLMAAGLAAFVRHDALRRRRRRGRRASEDQVRADDAGGAQPRAARDARARLGRAARSCRRPTASIARKTTG